MQVLLTGMIKTLSYAIQIARKEVHRLVPTRPLERKVTLLTKSKPTLGIVAPMSHSSRTHVGRRSSGAHCNLRRLPNTSAENSTCSE